MKIGKLIEKSLPLAIGVGVAIVGWNLLDKHVLSGLRKS